MPTIPAGLLRNVERQFADMRGIPIHLFKRPGMPLFIRVYIKAGAKYDNKPGTAHFLEHMLIAGTDQFPTKDKLTGYFERLGGQVALWTNSDFIKIDLEVAEESDIHEALYILDQILNHHSLSDPLIENERQSICTEYKSRRSNARESLIDEYKKVFYRNTLAGKSVIGDLESVLSIQKSDLIKHRDSYFIPANISVVVAGDVDISTVTSQLSPVLHKLKDTHTEPIALSAATPYNTSYGFVARDVPMVEVVLGYLTDMFDVKEKACLDILATYLGVGRSSLLVSELRYKKGLVYSVFCEHRSMIDEGALIVTTKCAAEHVTQVVEIIRNVLQGTIHDAAIQNEITYIKTRIAKLMAIKLQTSKSWIEYNEVCLHSQQKSTVFDYLKTLESITAQDVYAVAIKYFTPERFSIVAEGPKAARDHLPLSA